MGARYVDGMIFVGKYKFELVLALMVLCGILFNPYYFGIDDHSYKIPFLKALWDDALYPRDIAINMRHGYTSFFYLLIWPLQYLFGLETSFFVVYLATQVLFYVSIYLIAKTLTQEKVVGLIAVMLLLWPLEGLGGVDTFDHLVEERSIGFALLLFSLYLLFSGKYLGAGICSAVAANIHYVMAANVYLFVAAYILLECFVSGQNRIALRRIASFFIPIMVGSLPIVLKATGVHSNALTVVDPDWLAMIVFRSSHHFGPDYERFALFFGGGSLVLLLLKRERLSKKEKKPANIEIAYLGAFLTLLAGFVAATFFIEQYPLLLGVQLCLYRTSLVFLVLSAVTVGWLIYVAMLRLRIKHFLVIIMLALACELILHHPKITINYPDRSVGKYDMDVQLWLKNNTPQDALVMVAPYSEHLRIFSERSILGTWKDWTYNCLDRQYAFLLFERLQDIGGLVVDEANDWHRPANNKDYKNMSQEKIMALAQKYHLDYVVMPRRKVLTLNLAYKNKRYAVYEVRTAHAQPPAVNEH